MTSQGQMISDAGGGDPGPAVISAPRTPPPKAAHVITNPNANSATGPTSTGAVHVNTTTPEATRIARQLEAHINGGGYYRPPGAMNSQNSGVHFNGLRVFTDAGFAPGVARFDPTRAAVEDHEAYMLEQLKKLKNSTSSSAAGSRQPTCVDEVDESSSVQDSSSTPQDSSIDNEESTLGQPTVGQGQVSPGVDLPVSHASVGYGVNFNNNLNVSSFNSVNNNQNFGVGGFGNFPAITAYRIPYRRQQSSFAFNPTMPPFNPAMSSFTPAVGTQAPTNMQLAINQGANNNMGNYNAYAAGNINFLEGRQVVDRIKSLMPGLQPGSDYCFDADCPPPFIDLNAFAWPQNYPVLKITNIPFQSSKDEIRQFLKRYLLPHMQDDSNGHSLVVDVYIVMERTNAKTQDCFVELNSLATKQIVMTRYAGMMRDSRAPRMSNRIVGIEESDQGELMHEIFFHAECIRWDKEFGFPILTVNEDWYRSGFFGFVTDEELYLIVRYTLEPDRNPYGGKCLQRTYETMMTILSKFPWASPYYTLNDRNKLFDSYFQMLEYLDAATRTVGLGTKLIEEFGRAGLECVGFPEYQKEMIVPFVAGIIDDHELTSHAATWPFECLAKPAGMSDQDLTMWISLLLSGARYGMREFPNNIWNTPKFRVGPTQFGGVKFEIKPDAVDYGVRDLAMYEYGLMQYLIGEGWKVWFGARGIDPGHIPYPAKKYRIDEQLNIKMDNLGIYSRGGAREDDQSYIPRTRGARADRQIVEVTADDDIPIESYLAEEDATTIASTLQMSPSLQDVLDMEDAIERNRTPRAPSPDIVTSTPVSFNNPFGGPLHAGVSNVASIQFGSFGPGMTLGGASFSSMGSDVAPGSIGRRASKAVAIVAPDDENKSPQHCQAIINTPTRRQSSQVSSETIVEEGADKDGMVMVTGGSAGKKPAAPG